MNRRLLLRYAVYGGFPKDLFAENYFYSTKVSKNEGGTASINMRDIIGCRVDIDFHHRRPA